ncbi:MAG: hypothetical protein SV062_11970 [Thermodesulfobacteriota bacterium]|nr:hypothetical protein [Thermodesulfobacteriota bacterium]
MVDDNLNISELTVPINFFNYFCRKDNLEKVALEINGIHKLLKKNGIALNIALDQTCIGGKNLVKDFSNTFDSFMNLMPYKGVGIVLREPTFIQYFSWKYPFVPFTINAPSAYGIFDFHLRSRFYHEKFNKNNNLKKVYLPPDLNRDFRALKRIRDSAKYDLCVTVNEGEVLNSPYRLSELIALSHMDENTDPSYYKKIKEIFDDFRIEVYEKEPWRIIASPWIRPEDIKVYEEIGINTLVLLAGEEDMEGLEDRVNAYIKRSYKGNLTDLLRKKPFKTKGYINNDKLESFLKKIRKGPFNTCIFDCDRCGICEEFFKLMGKIDL